jgi:hypothetical protein
MRAKWILQSGFIKLLFVMMSRTLALHQAQRGANVVAKHL